MSRHFINGETSSPSTDTVCLGHLHLQRSISLFQVSSWMSQSLFRVIVLSLVAYTYFKLKIEQDAMPKLLLIKHETV